jgi:hypothetical protein
MAQVMRYVALPFARTQAGTLEPQQPVDLPGPGAAIVRAGALAASYAGAIAFTGVGRQGSALLAQFGDVPSDLFRH